MDEVIGITINEYKDYVLFMAKRHGEIWLAASERTIHKAFGKPMRYPFLIIEINNNDEDSWEDTKLVRVYF